MASNVFWITRFVSLLRRNVAAARNATRMVRRVLCFRFNCQTADMLPHPARLPAGERSREESAAKRNGLRLCSSCKELSSRSALLRRSSHKAPGPRFRDPADFFRSPLGPLEAEIFKRRRFFLRTGVLHSSHPRQRTIIGADGDPKPPQVTAANRDRRRRPFPATRTPREAPSMETTIRNIVLVEMGVNLNRHARESGHPVTSKARRWLLDSGSALRAVRNDGWSGSSPRMRDSYWRSGDEGDAT
jgi:hypothetical protein